MNATTVLLYYFAIGAVFGALAVHSAIQLTPKLFDAAQRFKGDVDPMFRDFLEQLPYSPFARIVFLTFVAVTWPYYVALAVRLLFVTKRDEWFNEEGQK